MPDLPYEVHPVRADLRPFVRRFLIADTTIRGSLRVRPAPTGYNYLSWYRGERLRTIVDGVSRDVVEAFQLAGQIQRQSIEVIHDGPRIGHILTEFTATGLARLLHVPGDRISGETVPLRRFAPAVADQLEAAVRDVPDSMSVRLSALQDALVALSPRAAPPIDYLEAAVALIEGSGGRMPVQDVAGAVGISPRQLSRRFIDVVGCNPKFFAKVVQMNEALAALLSDDTRKLTELCHEAGYFDQSHFVRVMHEFFGKAPTDFLESRDDVLAVFLGRAREVR